MALAFVQSAKGGNGGGSTTLSVTLSSTPSTTGLLICGVACITASGGVVSISQTNVTWALVDITTSVGFQGEYWYGIPSGGTPGTGVTITFGNTSGGRATVVAEFSGFTSPTIDVYDMEPGVANSGSPMTVPSGTINTTVANVGLIACLCAAAPNPVWSGSPTNSFTTADSFAGSGQGSVLICYREVSSTGTYDTAHTLTFVAVGNSASGIVAFDGLGGSGDVSPSASLSTATADMLALTQTHGSNISISLMTATANHVDASANGGSVGGVRRIIITSA